MNTFSSTSILSTSSLQIFIISLADFGSEHFAAIRESRSEHIFARMAETDCHFGDACNLSLASMHILDPTDIVVDAARCGSADATGTCKGKAGDSLGRLSVARRDCRFQHFLDSAVFAGPEPAKPLKSRGVHFLVADASEPVATPVTCKIMLVAHWGVPAES